MVTALSRLPQTGKEMAMNYRSKVLELLEKQPEIYDLLSNAQILRPTIERYTRELQKSYERWKDRLSQTDGTESQVEMDALEASIKELEDRLASDEPFGLEHIHPPPE
jgi:predicted  nucleic acid-binding Zn-ribbon protein